MQYQYKQIDVPKDFIVSFRSIHKYTIHSILTLKEDAIKPQIFKSTKKIKYWNKSDVCDFKECFLANTHRSNLQNVHSRFSSQVVNATL